MITFLVTMTVIVGFAILLGLGRGRAGSSNAVDRDNQRLQAELNAIFAHSHHH